MDDNKILLMEVLLQKSYEILCSLLESDNEKAFVDDNLGSIEELIGYIADTLD